MFPYHRYLRSLDLRDLENLLVDDKFRDKEERCSKSINPPSLAAYFQ